MNTIIWGTVDSGWLNWIGAFLGVSGWAIWEIFNETESDPVPKYIGDAIRSQGFNG